MPPSVMGCRARQNPDGQDPLQGPAEDELSPNAEGPRKAAKDRQGGRGQTVLPPFD